MTLHRPSASFAARPAGARIDMLVLHYTGMESAEAALARLCDPAAPVSAHYLVGEDGRVFRLVEERERAWHAGVASWRGASDINARSIGIELVNPGHEFGYRPFPKAQMAALIELAGDILARHPEIPPRNVVAHSDVAPTRKMDPGELFDWRLLAEYGIGLWPEEADALMLDPDGVAGMLAAFGYATRDRFAAIRAFQRHFRPERVNGRIDFGTVRRLAGLLALCEMEPLPGDHRQA
ncbi:MAG TPA: N-acetylmuramoyl-L-alanine amidase [Rhodospirillales bacterium]|nr:N-acetylmuramoyl-L-alanine amidase [Rhodospirillales bacterium]